ncbi:hypothetical protein PDJAM_G00148770 [Pangasius djambal]|uniref:Uncharacterized protein n=1 Tax=Pangasius djambal TaxID=1691987 RepID=A0ACC5ZGZ4_9TELE|nr:hypothetical protein [Pangasius djambal]
MADPCQSYRCVFVDFYFDTRWTRKYSHRCLHEEKAHEDFQSGCYSCFAETDCCVVFIMAEDMLMLNISNQDSTDSHFSERKHTKSSSGHKWTAKKTANGKRKASFGNQDYGSAKQRKLNAKISTKHEDQAASSFTSKPKTSPKIGQEEHKGHDRPFIKTSSLFRNNPEIPDVLSPAVTQVKEKVFTRNSFQELDLHPHLVATLNKVLNISSMTSVQKQTIPVLLSGKDAVVRSQTGSGKTLAYGIPLIQSLQAVQPKIKASET